MSLGSRFLDGVRGVRRGAGWGGALRLGRLADSLLAAVLAVGLCSCKPGGGAAGGAAQAPRVVVVPAVKERVTDSLSLVGSLSANEMVEVKAEADGVIQEIRFVEGQRVAKGDLLVVLDDSKLASALAEAEANFRLSRANFDRMRQLFEDRLVSRQEYDQAEATFQFNEASLGLKRRQLRDARVNAPFEGVVGARMVSPGQVITRNTTVTWVIDLDPIKVEVNVPERFVGQLRKGQRVSFAVAAFSGRRFEGEVYFIASHVEEVTRTALVKAAIPNPDSELLSGMFASLDLTLTVREGAIVVPEAALMMNAKGTSVYVVGAGDTAELRPVLPGLRMPGFVEVVNGLKEGERVVVEGLQKTIPGKPVRVAPDAEAAPYRRKPIESMKPKLD